MAPPRRLAPLFLVAVALGLAGAGPALAGQVVWSKGGQIWAMADDGTNPRVLIPLSAAPGMKELRSPAVHPAGAAVTFEGTTEANKISRMGLCGSFPYQYSCTTWHWGFNATGVYRWQAGTVQRLTADPAYCWNCTDSFVGPEPRADGTSVSAFQHCQGFLDDGSYDCVGAVKSTDGATYPSCDDLPDDPSPNPANPSQVAYVGCHSSGQDALVVTGPDRAGERVVACDDSEQDDPSWSPSGDRLVTAEAGAERGLWVYGAGNAGCGAGSLRHAVVAPDDVAFDSPRFAGPDRIVFEAKGELWSVAASCDRCAFPAQATQLTTGGDNHEPAWTADPLAVPVAPSGGGGGGDGGTTPGGTTPGGGAPSDTTRPVLTVTAAGAQRILRQSRSIVLRVRSGEAATLTAKGTIAVPGKDPSIKATTMRLAAGRTATLKLKLSATALAAVRRAWARHRKATAVLKLSARDAAGNAATATRRIALRR